MNQRYLGWMALLGAPFLFITYLVFGESLDKQKTALDGLFSLFYITGWICSILGLWQAEATGTKRWGRIVLLIQLLFLTLANVSNLMLATQLGITTKLYFVLDLFWPISNIWMLATGISIITAKRLEGFSRYMPLLVGLWLPLTVLAMVVAGNNIMVTWISGLYSAIAWSLLALVVLRLAVRQRFLKAHMAY
jgi:hypothetical protein